MGLPGRPRTLVVPLDLADPPSLQAAGWPPDPGVERVLALVRLHGAPLGLLELGRSQELDVVDVRKRSTERFGEQIRLHLERDDEGGCCSGLTRLDPCRSRRLPTAPFATVVVTTCGGPDSEPLERTLRSVLDLDYPSFEVLVVDNRPGTSGVREVLRAWDGDERVRLLEEPKPGLSAARNCGLRAARGEVVAFTDDDVLVDPEWLRALVATLIEEHADGVTGLILARDLHAPAQVIREELRGFGKGFERRVFDLSSPEPDPLFPYAVGAFGSGASALFRRDVLRELGGFDEALGTGTRSLGGEDLDLHLRMVLAGRRLAYEPSALLWHEHYADERAFRRQLLHYGAGLTAVLAKHFVTQPAERRQMLRRVPAGVRHLRAGAPKAERLASASTRPPRSLFALQAAGMLYGPIGWARAAWRERRQR